MKPAISLQELQQLRILELLQILEDDLCLEHVLLKDFQNWTLENPELADNEHIRYEHNFLTERLIIKCMPTVTHDSLQSYYSIVHEPARAAKRLELHTALIIQNNHLHGFPLPLPIFPPPPRDSSRLEAPPGSSRLDSCTTLCEAGWTEGWEKLMEDTQLWLLCTGGKTKIVIILSFIETKSTTSSDSVAESESENNTTDGSGKTEEQNVIDAINTSTREPDLAQKLQQLDGRAKLRKPLIGELTATLHVYRASDDYKDIVEWFNTTVLPLPPSNFTGPREFQITLHEIFGNDVPEGMDSKDPITFSLPVLEAFVTGSLEHTAWYRANKLAKKLMKEAGVWEEKETFTQSKRRRLG
ncbi:hypothetical protein HOY82DRAFT_540723 [Tuber indicum]|nr:hypothetical protein HOY82DRAFT_540723 [Tuber indicum]